MTIVFVSYEFPPYTAVGGIGTCVLHTVKLLTKAGHKVYIISANPKDSERVIEKDGYINYLIYAKDQQQFRDKALDLFEKYFEPSTVDLIESPEVGACALNIKIKYPEIPLIVRLHTPGVIITKVSRYYQSFIVKLRFVFGSLLRGKINLGYWDKVHRTRFDDKEYQICNLASTLISPSEALRRSVMKLWRISESNIIISPNPFEPNLSLLSSSIESKIKVICFVGKLSVLKGMTVYSQSLKKILKKYPHYRAVLIGRDEDDFDKQTSMSLWMKSKLNDVLDKVDFKGALSFEHVKTFLSSSNIVVIPSLWENYPMVLLEAMSAGCAVVASNRGGIPEIINHGQNGLLCNPFSINDIVKKVEMLITQDEIRIHIAKNGRKWIENRSNESNLKQIEEIYLKASLIKS